MTEVGMILRTWSVSSFGTVNVSLFRSYAMKVWVVQVSFDQALTVFLENVLLEGPKLGFPLLLLCVVLVHHGISRLTPLPRPEEAG